MGSPLSGIEEIHNSSVFGAHSLARVGEPNKSALALSIAAFQRDLAYKRSYLWGRLLALLELLLTSILVALFFLAVRRQFRR
jgi:hypothetical protein